MGQLVLPLKDVGSQARCHFNNGIFSNFSLSTYLKKSTKKNKMNHKALTQKTNITSPNQPASTPAYSILTA
jgi:hypothetical protein